jgi:hypothetical protein
MCIEAPRTVSVAGDETGDVRDAASMGRTVAQVCTKSPDHEIRDHRCA